MSELNGLTPYIEVYDMVASVAFYCGTVGFEILEGRFSHFVRLGRGRAEIMLNTAYDSNERPPIGARRVGRAVGTFNFTSTVTMSSRSMPKSPVADAKLILPLGQDMATSPLLSPILTDTSLSSSARSDRQSLALQVPRPTHCRR
jgi:hypothetical protein